MAAAAAWLFYQSGIAAVVLSPLAIPYCIYRLKGEREKKKRILSEQFRELLDSVNNALRSGDSPENAFREGYREMVYEYGEYAPITRELTMLVGGLDNRIPLEKLLNEISIMLGNRRLEQRIMDVTPFMIIFYIGMTSPGFFDVLYHNPEGIAFMTLCLGAYLCALALSEKILSVTL